MLGRYHLREAQEFSAIFNCLWLYSHSLFSFAVGVGKQVKEKTSCPCWQHGRLLEGPWGLSCKVLVRMRMLVIKYRLSSSWRKEVETLWLEKRRKTETLAKVRKLGDREGKWSHRLRVLYPCHLWWLGDKSLHFWLVRFLLFAILFVSKNYHSSAGFLQPSLSLLTIPSQVLPPYEAL